MSATKPTHELIEDLVRRVQTFLPADYYLGYELIHTNVSDAERIRSDNDIKARWRERLGGDKARGKTGAGDDLSALPGDATTLATAHVLFEVLHLPTGLQAVRTVPMDTLISVATQWQTANATQRANIQTQVENYLKGFYALCAARVAA